MSTKRTEIACTFTELAAAVKDDSASKVSHIRATSLALLPVTPMVSNEAVKWNMPRRGTKPGLSFEAYSAATAARRTTDPDVWIP